MHKNIATSKLIIEPSLETVNKHVCNALKGEHFGKVFLNTQLKLENGLNMVISTMTPPKQEEMAEYPHSAVLCQLYTGTSFPLSNLIQHSEMSPRYYLYLYAGKPKRGETTLFERHFVTQLKYYNGLEFLQLFLEAVYLAILGFRKSERVKMQGIKQILGKGEIYPRRKVFMFASGDDY